MAQGSHSKQLKKKKKHKMLTKNRPKNSVQFILWGLFNMPKKKKTSPIYTVLDVQSEKAMAPHSSTLAWKIPRAGEPGRLQSMGSLRVGQDWATSLSLFTFMHWRRKWQPTPVFLPGESQRWGEPGGLPSMGSHRVGHNWSDLTAAAADVQ